MKQRLTRNIIFDEYEDTIHINNIELSALRITPTRAIFDYDSVAMFFFRLDHS